LRCKNCNTRYDVPLNLPCGETVCQKCQDPIKLESDKNEIRYFTCLFCNNEHSMPDGGLVVNKTIMRLLNVEAKDAKRVELLDHIKTSMKNIIDKQLQLENLDYRKVRINTYFENIIQQVFKKTEDRILEMNDLFNRLVEKIDNTRIEYLNKLEVKSFDEIADRVNQLKTEWSEKIKLGDLNDLDANTAHLQSQEIESTIDSELAKLNNELRCLLSFQVNEKPINEKLVGILKFHNENEGDVTIPADTSMTTEMPNRDKDIINLKNISTILSSSNYIFRLDNLLGQDYACSPNKWKLLYRASEDGFGANVFHDKCNGQERTISVIRAADTNYIFGGYASVAWDSVHEYKQDPDSFIFSLINEKDTPLIFKNNDHNGNFDYSICTNSNYGPTFGVGHDLHICSDSNTTDGSYSNLGNTFVNSTADISYDEYFKFLAGSHKFLVSEIEVFQISRE